MVTPFSLCCAGRGAAGRLLPSPPGSARGECPRRCNDGHRLLDFASPILGIGNGQPDGESSAVYLKGQAAALVIVRQAAMGGIFCRIRRQSIFQVGVVSTDGDSAADFVKPYLGQLVFLLDSCNHFEFHLISDRICKRPVFAGKSPVQDRQNSQIF